jgi:hypothetical protein
MPVDQRFFDAFGPEPGFPPIFGVVVASAPPVPIGVAVGHVYKWSLFEGVDTLGNKLRMRAGLPLPAPFPLDAPAEFNIRGIGYWDDGHLVASDTVTIHF